MALLPNTCTSINIVTAVSTAPPVAQKENVLTILLIPMAENKDFGQVIYETHNLENFVCSCGNPKLAYDGECKDCWLSTIELQSDQDFCVCGNVKVKKYETCISCVKEKNKRSFPSKQP